MTIIFEFDFKNKKDFVEFMHKHKDTIDAMGAGDRVLSKEITEQVDSNERLPEHFTFDDHQYAYMIRWHNQGMQSLVNDDRVSVRRKRSEGDE